MVADLGIQYTQIDKEKFNDAVKETEDYIKGYEAIFGKSKWKKQFFENKQKGEDWYEEESNRYKGW